jgi:hypothetical protein
VVVAVRLGVVNEPVVPDPPVPEEEVHDVLSVDDQLTVVLALLAIEVDAAEMDTVGMAGVLVVEEPPPLEHEARPITTHNSAAKRTFSRTPKPTGLLFDMNMSSQ